MTSPTAAADAGTPTETSVEQHLSAGRRQGPLGFAVITFSDTRTPATDSSGQAAQRAIVDAGHAVVRYMLTRDDRLLVRQAVGECLADPAVAVVVTSGGTGIALRDNAFEAISALLEKPLPGFGELFRMLSFAEIGSAAMLSRAVGGIAQGKVIFALPGSTKAVELGLAKLILPQAGHLYYELHK